MATKIQLSMGWFLDWTQTEVTQLDDLGSPDTIEIWWGTSTFHRIKRKTCGCSWINQRVAAALTPCQPWLSNTAEGIPPKIVILIFRKWSSTMMIRRTHLWVLCMPYISDDCEMIYGYLFMIIWLWNSLLYLWGNIQYSFDNSTIWNLDFLKSLQLDFLRRPGWSVQPPWQPMQPMQPMQPAIYPWMRPMQPMPPMPPVPTSTTATSTSTPAVSWTWYVPGALWCPGASFMIIAWRLIAGLSLKTERIVINSHMII